MKFIETKLKGAFVVEIEKTEDSWGFFGRAWCKNEFEQKGLKTNICQINTSKTLKRGTIRGLHYQVEPHLETKLVRCIRGSIYDVIVDLRPSPLLICSG
ncbi:dTDP-4-dehydrorhamnose 3,5-epimerase [bacterium BMS3Abin04]|nr:dTDP-4-dehydrorhamnose 3,5-epimerase [bacterium BMS3Abin04]